MSKGNGTKRVCGLQADMTGENKGTDSKKSMQEIAESLEILGH